jgi:hypothetical protein
MLYTLIGGFDGLPPPDRPDVSSSMTSEDPLSTPILPAFLMVTYPDLMIMPSARFANLGGYRRHCWPTERAEHLCSAFSSLG